MRSPFEFRTFFSKETALNILFGRWFNFNFTADDDKEEDSGSPGPHGVSSTTVGVSVLVHDLFNFENNSQVPEGLSKYVELSRKAQTNWYRKLLKAWKQAKPSPKTAEEAARLVIQTLDRDQKADVKGFLTYYVLSLPDSIVEISTDVPTPLPKGVKFEMETLPVHIRSVPDGDGVTVYVSTADPRESSCVPREIQEAVEQRSQARALENKQRANELQQEIIDAGYRVIYLKNDEEEVLARKYRIRLRGIDAPENSMPYGKEAKDALVEIVEGNCLRVQVYGVDQYGRYVADVYCNGKLVQELMLKKGLAWHYTNYDKRKEFAKWEKKARKKRRGLWASSDPEKPWEWRKKQRESSNGCSTSQCVPEIIVETQPVTVEAQPQNINIENPELVAEETKQQPEKME